MEGGITWDPTKAEQNHRKHGVTFEQASSVFADPLAETYPDPDHSVREEREITVGYSMPGRLLLVIHVSRGRVTRIISARMVTRHERRDLEARRR